MERRGIARQAQRIAKAGHLIDAIRLVRSHTDCSILQAKNAVEQLRALPDIQDSAHTRLTIVMDRIDAPINAVISAFWTLLRDLQLDGLPESLKVRYIGGQ